MTEALSPHPPLKDYYGEPAGREQFVRELFDHTAHWYDDINDMLSFGSGGRYRREALVRAGLKSGMRLLDMATGTGVVAREALKITPHVIGADASIGMLHAGRSRQLMPIMESVGEHIAARDGSFDMIVTGYALRHFADLHGVFSEYRRILRPGGRVLILELTPPRSRAAYVALRFYMNRLVPLLARLRSGDREAATLMHYYWDTIDTCVPPDRILDALRSAGFTDVARFVAFGMCSEYTGTKEG